MEESLSEESIVVVVAGVAEELSSFAEAISGFIPSKEEPTPATRRPTNILRVSKSTSTSSLLLILLSLFKIVSPRPDSGSTSGFRRLQMPCCWFLEGFVIAAEVVVEKECTGVGTGKPISKMIKVQVNSSPIDDGDDGIGSVIDGLSMMMENESNRIEFVFFVFFDVVSLQVQNHKIC